MIVTATMRLNHPVRRAGRLAIAWLLLLVTVLTDGAARTYRLGTRWTSVSGLTLNVEVQRQAPAAA